jgi:hypothetical protein
MWSSVAVSARDKSRSPGAPDMCPTMISEYSGPYPSVMPTQGCDMMLIAHQESTAMLDPRPILSDTAPDPRLIPY